MYSRENCHCLSAVIVSEIEKPLAFKCEIVVGWGCRSVTAEKVHIKLSLWKRQFSSHSQAQQLTESNWIRVTQYPISCASWRSDSILLVFFRSVTQNLLVPVIACRNLLSLAWCCEDMSLSKAHIAWFNLYVWVSVFRVIFSWCCLVWRTKRCQVKLKVKIIWLSYLLPASVVSTDCRVRGDWVTVACSHKKWRMSYRQGIAKGK